MKNRLVIVRRQSPEWGLLTKDEFREQSRRFCNIAGLPTEQVNLTVDLWDNTFSMPYCSVRQALKDIAIDNLRHVHGTDLITLEKLSTDVVHDHRQYLFIDDDDWLCPEIASFIPSGIDETYEGIVWGSIAFGTHKKQLIQTRAIDGFCYTNNYVVMGKALKHGINIGRSPAQHWDAESALKGRSLILEKYLSVTNKSPSSTCYLMHVLQGNYHDGELLEDAISEYLTRCETYQSQLPPMMDWAVPLIERTLDVFRRL